VWAHTGSKCQPGRSDDGFEQLNDSIYWRDHDGLYVNLFIRSDLDWAEKGFMLRQETGYPGSQNTTLTVIAARQDTLAMRLRIPGWLRSAPTITLNGKALDASAAPGSYFTLNRAWKAGDRVEMELPMHLSVEAMPDDSRLQAFLYGPQVLAGDPGVPGRSCGPEFVDQAHGQAAGLPDDGAEEGRDAAAVEQPVRPALLGVLGGGTRPIPVVQKRRARLDTCRFAS
jgi:DUF1680 family protein